MPDGFTVDYSDFSRLIADIDKSTRLVPERCAQALEVSARHIKDDWRAAWVGSPHVKAGAASITYDLSGVSSMLLGRSAMSAEIGPDTNRKHGGLVGMLETGTPNTGPRGFGVEALRKNEADFVRGIEKATEAIL